MQTHDDFATTKTYPEALLLLLPLLLLLLLPLLLLLMLLLVFFLCSTLLAQLFCLNGGAAEHMLGRPQAQPFLQCLK